ncbi:MAG TPA: GNAT family protein [Chloroflexota bacterium]|nr:GNAT family protein [Chloroflexota bacterium]
MPLGARADLPPAAEIHGEPIAWTAARVPAHAVLAGATVRLEPVNPHRHGKDLFAAARDGRDPQLWDYMSVGPFADEQAFAAWLATTVTSTDPLFFTVVDARTERASGMASYLRITPANGVIEIGNIWFGPDLQRTRQATEAIFLLARHVFDDLGYRRLEWKCNALNRRSRQAAERFGFSYEGIFRQHMVVKGRNRDTAWFAMLDRDWPLIRAAFEAWLAPENVDSDGRQRRSLRTIRAAIAQGTSGLPSRP